MRDIVFDDVKSDWSQFEVEEMENDQEMKMMLKKMRQSKLKLDVQTPL